MFGQTLQDYEVIVVDDGSTDGTRKFLEPYLPRLRYLFQHHAGPSAARNRGAELAGGKYLAFLDSDDCWEPNYLARTIDYLEAHPQVGLLATSRRVIRADGELTRQVVDKRSPGPIFTTRSLLAGDVGTIINPVIRRPVFIAAGGYDTSMGQAEDSDLWIRLSFLTEMRHLPEPLLRYRTHAGNLSSDVLANARAWLRLLEKLGKDHPDFVALHPVLVQRAWAAQSLRIGRELIMQSAANRQLLAEARQVFRRAVRLDPRQPRAYVYLAVSWLPGASVLYPRWRRKELAMRALRVERGLLAGLFRSPSRESFRR